MLPGGAELGANALIIGNAEVSCAKRSPTIGKAWQDKGVSIFSPRSAAPLADCKGATLLNWTVKQNLASSGRRCLKRTRCC